MNRRNFIKLFGYIPGLALLPSLGQAAADFNSEELPEQLLNEGNTAKSLYESLLSTSKFLEDIPKFGVLGNALAYNQTHDNRIIPISTPLNFVHGDIEIAGKDTYLFSAQLLSKTKSCGRKLLDDITNSEKGLISLAGNKGKGLQYLFDSNPDWIMANTKEIRQLRQIPEVLKYITKHNIKVYPNDYMDSYKSEIIAGKFDDGTHINGCSLMYSKGIDGILPGDSYKGLIIEKYYSNDSLVLEEKGVRIKYYQNLVI